MSDQNDRSKPDETPDRASGQESNQPAASASTEPERGHDPAARDPFASSGQGSAAQGVTDPAGDPSGRAASSGQPTSGQQSPYATPGQSGSHAAYGSQAGQYGSHQAGRYGSQNQYGAQQAGSNQYGSQQAGQGQYGSQNPYGASNPYGGQNPSGSQGQYGGQKASSQSPYGQQPHGQQQYGQQSYGAQQGTAAGYNPYAASSPYAYGQQQKTSVLAILSIVFAFGGLLFGPLTILTSPAGAIMGHVALGRIKQTGEQGRGLALAGIIGGWIITALAVIGVVGFILFAVFASQNPNYGGYDDYNGYDTSSTAAVIA
ncbi:DUF4190 domain-containing protein [Curtobacterium sp. MCBD17_008]|uniref:DUF4190 domain-containing protein n=1 Tax=Curtobacterium sp. MCBD17_008 TaxID=2175656 RepID=UPI000DA87E67|nr:DUF4190 domain-containing protein [Curtobacterium sp. MCBD17_008]PZE94567.1 hypothetical protein DEI95_03815 [Curtobacterium sp. MCBD17_008]